MFTPCGRDDGVVIRLTNARYMHQRGVEHYKEEAARAEKRELRNDEEAEAFVASSDLTEYDLSAMRVVRFEFQPKSERVNMRLPRPLPEAVKAAAAKAGAPYQRFIRQALETAVQPREES